MVVQIIEKPVIKSTTRNHTDILKKKGDSLKILRHYKIENPGIYMLISS